MPRTSKAADEKLWQRREGTRLMILGAAQVARTDPMQGVYHIIRLLEAAGKDGTEVQAIMDFATDAGFVCEFWPTGIRVSWQPRRAAGDAAQRRREGAR